MPPCLTITIFQGWQKNQIKSLTAVKALHYISLGKIIEENKERYYETLEQSAQGWHEWKHDPWPFINYILSILKTAYKDFEGRVGEIQVPKGSKTESIMATIEKQRGKFSVADLQKACPASSIDILAKPTFI